MAAPTIGYRLAALAKVWSVAWPTRAAFRNKLRVLRSNSRTALRHPHLFDDDLQGQRLRRLGELVRGKTVAVVGNAQYLLETKVGPEIDGHDIVIRFNYGFVVDPSSQGARTDVHCVADNVSDVELARHCPGALVVYASPVRSHLNVAFRHDPNDSICVPLRDWRRLVRALGNQRPSAGFVMVDYLLNRSDAALVTIYGFDWKRTKSFYHRAKIRDWHSGEAERQLLLQWAAKHGPRLSFGNCPTGLPG